MDARAPRPDTGFWHGIVVAMLLTAIGFGVVWWVFL